MTKLTLTLPTYIAITENSNGYVQHTMNALIEKTYNDIIAIITNNTPTIIIKKIDIVELKTIPKSPILRWVYYTTQQLHLYNSITKQLPNNSLLCLQTLNGTLGCMTPDIGMITHDVYPDKFEINLLETLCKRYAIVEQLLFLQSGMFTNKLCKNSYKTIKLFKKHVLYYVCDIMQPHKLLNDILMETNVICECLNNILNTSTNKAGPLVSTTYSESVQLDGSI